MNERSTTPNRRRAGTGTTGTALAALAALAVLVAACGDDDATDAAATTTTASGSATTDGDAATTTTGDGGDEGPAETTGATLVLNWTPNAHHLGVYAAQHEGWYADAGIDLEILEPTAAGVAQAIGTGDAEFGISVAESVIPARAEGVPIVSIATILPVNDSVMMSLPEDGITAPADLAGKEYGGYGGSLETELVNRLVSCDGGDPDEVAMTEVGNVDYLSGLEADRFDFVWVFEGWDGLRAEVVEGRDVDYVRFSDHLDCIPNWYTPLFITSEDLIENDPALVQAFMDATAQGYELAMEDPAAAADAMLDLVPEMDEQLIRAAAEYHAPLFAADGSPFGAQERDVWASFDEFLVEAGLTEQPSEIDDAFTNDFVLVDGGDVDEDEDADGDTADE
ncbi:MAG: ABC transporter substrate-binding protein [Actinomycetota bacterium]|nr:ABC transporter substrate-binding protein [Actinomycetota bacterium]